YILVILSGKTFSDTVFHQTGKRGQYIDRRIDCLSVKLALQNDLSLGNVPCQVRHGVGDIIIRHGQDRDLGRRSCPPSDNTGPFVQGGKLAVKISRIALPGRDLSFGGGNLTHSLAERGDIRKDDQDMHAFFKGQILCGSKSYLRSDQPFHHRVVGKVQIHHYV